MCRGKMSILERRYDRFNRSVEIRGERSENNDIRGGVARRTTEKIPGGLAQI